MAKPNLCILTEKPKGCSLEWTMTTGHVHFICPKYRLFRFFVENGENVVAEMYTFSYITLICYSGISKDGLGAI